jgi:hypothetical protein
MVADNPILPNRNTVFKDSPWDMCALNVLFPTGHTPDMAGYLCRIWQQAATKGRCIYVERLMNNIDNYIAECENSVNPWICLIFQIGGS